MLLRTVFLLTCTLFFLLGCQQRENTGHQNFSDSKFDRTILPIQPPTSEPITEMDARNVTKPEIFEIKAPEGAPNIVIVLIDDIGFGATTTFGGAIETPTFDRLADNGLRFNQLSYNGFMFTNTRFFAFRKKPSQCETWISYGSSYWF